MLVYPRRQGKKFEWSQETNLWKHPLPKEQVQCSGRFTGSGMMLLVQAVLFALDMTNIRIHLPDLTAIFDTGIIEFILQAWRRKMESWSWLCFFLSDGSRRVITSICSVSSRMHKASSCLLFPTRLRENSRSEAQRCCLSSVPAKLWHFPVTARIVFPLPAVPMPIKEKLLDERQRSWLRPNTWSWELMLGIRKHEKEIP